MHDLILIGKKRTVLISISLMLVVIQAIYSFNRSVPEVLAVTIVRQIIRVGLWIALLILLYKGIKWARIVSIALLIIGVGLAAFGFWTTNNLFLVKVPFVVMIFVYSVALYHFGFSKSYKAFANFQRNKGTNPEQ